MRGRRASPKPRESQARPRPSRPKPNGQRKGEAAQGRLRNAGQDDGQQDRRQRKTGRRPSKTARARRTTGKKTARQDRAQKPGKARRHRQHAAALAGTKSPWNAGVARSIRSRAAVVPCAPRRAGRGVALAGGCRNRLHFAPEAIAAHHLLDGARPTFMLGAATSAHQIEGGTHNDWTEWERAATPTGRRTCAGRARRAPPTRGTCGRPISRRCSSSGPTPTAWVSNGAGSNRPQGVWDRPPPPAIARCWRRCAPRASAPMVTLYHFTLPPWVAAARRLGMGRRARGVRRVRRARGRRVRRVVDWWCTINEPNVLVAKGYLAGQWPPGARIRAGPAQALRALMRRHALATAACARRSVDADGDGHATRIGIAQNLRVFDPLPPHPVDGIVAGVAGEGSTTIRSWTRSPGAHPHFASAVIDIDEPYSGAGRQFDYLGVNYYTREFVIGHLLRPRALRDDRARDLPRNDMGWEIYPEGLYRLLMRYATTAGRCS